MSLTPSEPSSELDSTSSVGGEIKEIKEKEKGEAGKKAGKGKKEEKSQDPQAFIQVVKEAAINRNVDGFVAYCFIAFAAVKYLVLRNALAEILPLCADAPAFVLDAIEVLEKSKKAGKPLIKLLLESMNYCTEKGMIQLRKDHVDAAVGMIENVSANSAIGIAESFQLSKFQADKTLLLKIARKFLNDTLYKEGVSCIVKFNLQSFFSPEEVLRPILQNYQHAIAITYVNNTPGIEETFMNLVEDFMKNSLPIWLVEFNRGNIAKENDVKESLTALHTENSLIPKDFLKSAVKYAEQLKIDLTPERYPSICQASDLAALKWLVKSRQKQKLEDIHKGKKVDTANWDSLIDILVEGHSYLQLFYARKLMEYDEKEEAEKFAQFHQIPKENYEFIKAWQDLFNFSRQKKFISTKKKPSYQRPPDLLVEFVDTVPKLEACMSVLSKAQLVGIDCEWRPAIGRFRQSKLALFQIAVKGHVFLIDLLTLTEPEMTPFFTFLFSLKTLLKLGYQFDSDKRQLSRSYPNLHSVFVLESYLELLEYDVQVTRKARKKRKIPENELKVEKKGLSGLVSKYLKRSLDKHMQISDWSKRPLSPSQLDYSISDAYVLIDLYNEMTRISDLLDSDENFQFQEDSSDESDEDDNHFDEDNLEEFDDEEESNPNDNNNNNRNNSQQNNEKGKEKIKGKSNPDDDSHKIDLDLFERKLEKQIKYYISQRSLAKNDYVRKAMDQDGFISLSLLLSMGKVTTLLEDFHMADQPEEIIRVIKKSPLFEMKENNEGVRLKNPDEPVFLNFWELRKTFSVGSNAVASEAMNSNPDSVNKPYLEPSSLCILVDSMMGKLGKKLRCCGVDTLIVSPQNQNSIVEIIEKTGRILITRGKGFAQFRKILPESLIFNVTVSSLPSQLLQVLTHFNVKVRQGDLFSRCPVCNAAAFIRRNQEEIRAKFNLGGVPPGVVQNVTEFFECSGCTKIYWEGGHIGTAMEEFFGFLIENQQAMQDENEDQKVIPYLKKIVLV